MAKYFRQDLENFASIRP